MARNEVKHWWKVQGSIESCMRTEANWGCWSPRHEGHGIVIAFALGVDHAHQS